MMGTRMIRKTSNFLIDIFFQINILEDLDDNDVALDEVSLHS